MPAGAGFAPLGFGLLATKRPLRLPDGLSANGFADRLLRALRSRDEIARHRGTAAPNMLAFAAPLRAVPDTMYWKAPQSASGFPCMLPSVLDVTFAEGQRHIIVLIDLSHLRSTLDAEVFSALETAASTRLLPAAPHDASAFGGWLLGLLRQVRTRPEILRHPEAVRSIETDLIYRPATAVYPHTRGLVRIRQPRRATGLDRALEYLRTQHPGDVGVMQLSKAAALSQRSLERAFQDRFDMTARDFLCLRRHHAVRRVLMAARKGETSVAAVAYEHGFYELGRFAGNYFRMFGERPSETLAREFPGLPRGIRPEIE